MADLLVSSYEVGRVVVGLAFEGFLGGITVGIHIGDGSVRF